MGRRPFCAARASGYTNAGTIEFLVDDSGYYFMELECPGTGGASYDGDGDRH